LQIDSSLSSRRTFSNNLSMPSDGSSMKSSEWLEYSGDAGGISSDFSSESELDDAFDAMAAIDRLEEMFAFPALMRDDSEGRTRTGSDLRYLVGCIGRRGKRRRNDGDGRGLDLLWMRSTSRSRANRTTATLPITLSLLRSLKALWSSPIYCGATARTLAAGWIGDGTSACTHNGSVHGYMYVYMDGDVPIVLLFLGEIS
jgi:hypothetical protein